MKRTRIIIMCMLLICCLCPLFIYLSRADSFISNFFIGLFSSGLLVLFGFCVDYFEKKQSISKQLEELYKILRFKYIGHIFYGKTFSYSEVTTLYLNILCKYKPIVLDYSPIVLSVKANIIHIINRLPNKKIEVNYYKENRYALIQSVFGDLYIYFHLIFMYQGGIDFLKNDIDFYKKKIDRLKSNNEDYCIQENKLECCEKFLHDDTKLLKELKIDMVDLKEKCNAIDFKMGYPTYEFFTRT